MTYTLVILRHGNSEWNSKNLFTGWVDVDLSDQGREALAIEGPARRASPAEEAVVALEDFSNLGDGAVAVVRHAFDEEERAAGAGALVEDLFVVCAFELSGALFHRAVDDVARHGLPLGVGDGLAQAGITAHITTAHARSDGELFD